MLDNSGNVKDAIVYDGFGNIISETNSAYRGNYAWTGRMFDVETDLQYNRARWYDSATGRWQSQDPLALDNDLNARTTTAGTVLESLSLAVTADDTTGDVTATITDTLTESLQTNGVSPFPNYLPLWRLNRLEELSPLNLREYPAEREDSCPTSN